MTQFSTVVFDFDGTMVDSLDVVVDDVNRVMKGFGRRPIKEATIERTISGGANSFFNRFRLFRILTDKLVAVVQREQGRHIGELEPVPGLLAVFLLLRKRGYRLGIVSSNTVKNVTAYLDKHGWKTLFDFIYADGEVSNKGELMKRMLIEHHLSSGKIIYVGDEPRDILAARGAGVEAVAVTWGFQPKRAFAEVNPRWLIKTPKELLTICSERPWWHRLLMQTMNSVKKNGRG